MFVPCSISITAPAAVAAFVAACFHGREGSKRSRSSFALSAVRVPIYTHRALLQGQIEIAMKPISIFIMFIYVLLPFVCLTHPIESRVKVSSEIFDIFTSECPDKQGKDNGKTACCCAEYAPPFLTDINIFTTKTLRTNTIR